MLSVDVCCFVCVVDVRCSLLLFIVCGVADVWCVWVVAVVRCCLLLIVVVSCCVLFAGCCCCVVCCSVCLLVLFNVVEVCC